MKPAMGNGLVVHGGGPTAVLNASLAGVVDQWRKTGLGKLYGALGGAAGLLEEKLADLGAASDGLWRRIAEAPGSVLGSSRRNLGAEDLAAMVGILRRRDIRSVFPTGGNGTMLMALALAEAAKAAAYDVRVVAIPKTIDNDLMGTDHSPGYASAARFFAAAVRDIGADNRALPGVTVVEILGRNCGWLAAATVLARARPDDAPHLIYLPECRLAFDRLAADVERARRRFGRAVIAVCEGQLDETGEPFGAETRTTSREPLALNLAHVLSQRLSRALGIKARSEKPGLLGRSCAALASRVDRREAALCGRAAVRAACDGAGASMVTLERQPGAAYRCRTGLAPLAQVAGGERRLPPEWWPAEASDPLSEFRAWVEPLAGPIEALPLLAPGRDTY